MSSSKKRLVKVLIFVVGVALGFVLVRRSLPPSEQGKAAQPEASEQAQPPASLPLIYVQAKTNKEAAPNLPVPGAPWITDGAEEPEPRSSDELTHCASDAKQPPAERASCWWALAHRDRAGTGKRLASLPQASSDELGLAVLVEAYRAYPSQESMEAQLRGLGLVQRERPPLTPAAVTLAEALRRHDVVASFDGETGQFPNQHDQLLYELARMTGALAGVVFREQAPPEDSEAVPYQLDAWLDGLHYRLPAQNLGDWFDLDTVVGLLNTLLAARKSEVRVLPLATDEQLAQLAIAPQASLLRAVQAGVLRSDNPDQARQLGKDYEQRVIEQLQRGE